MDKSLVAGGGRFMNLHCGGRVINLGRARNIYLQVTPRLTISASLGRSSFLFRHRADTWFSRTLVAAQHALTIIVAHPKKFALSQTAAAVLERENEF